MKREEFRFVERLRVRWAEIDAQNIVFNGHYLTYFDTAVAGYWRALAMPYAQTMAQLSGDMFVRKATLDYLGSARYDDVLQVGMRCAKVGNSSMLFTGGVFRQDRLLVSCELVYVFADPHSQTSRAVPQPLRDTLTAYEAGQPMIRVQLGTWDAIGAEAQALRTSVFVQEQQIPAELEWDAADHSAVHAVASNRFGLALATGRWVPYAPGVAKIGRMAVMQSMRNTGVGRLVLDALMTSAAEAGNSSVLLHAQASAIPFYTRAGFEPQGPVFLEAGIAHQEMVRPLAGRVQAG